MDEVMINIFNNDDDSFVGQLRAKAGRVYVNKDLVGEPLNVGIYDETTGKVVERLDEKPENPPVIPEEGGDGTDGDQSAE